MSTMRMNPETGYPEIMPDSRIPPGGHTLGRIGGLPGLQPPPLDPRQQIQQLTRPPPGQSIFGGSMPRIRPTPPKAEGLGVSSFVGASSNDMQRMLNRGSISGDNMGDAQRRMEQLRSNEFLAKMRAQNPERFNNPPPTAPTTDPRIFPTPPPPPLAGGTPQFPGSVPPGVDPGTLPRPPNPFLTGMPQQFPSTAQPFGQGIMGQAPGFMTQYLDMMRSPMQGYGGGGMDSNPMLQYQMPPNQSPMQTYGSQNNAPIQSPFA